MEMSLLFLILFNMICIIILSFYSNLMFRKIMLARKMNKKNLDKIPEKDEERLNALEKNQIRSNQITAVLLTLSLILSILVVTGILPLTDSPRTLAYETIERTDGEETYKITIRNHGSIAHNLRVEIDLPSDTTFTEIKYLGSSLTKINEDIDENRNYYYVVFSCLQEGEYVGIQMTLQNNDFVDDDSLLIKPLTYVWTDEEGKIEIKSS